MDTSLIISATKDGKKLQKAITNINPEKDNQTLKTFAQKVNGLTTNNYLDATRVNKMSVEEEDQQGGGSGKQEGVITVTTNDYGYTYTVDYNGDGELFIVAGADANSNQPGTLSGNTITATQVSREDYEGTGYVVALATDNYTAAIASFKEKRVY